MDLKPLTDYGWKAKVGELLYDWDSEETWQQLDRE